LPVIFDGVPAVLRQQVEAALRGVASAQSELIVHVELTETGWRVTVEPEGPSLLPRIAHDDVADMMTALLNTTMPNRLRR
jgi:hypothetical protein